MLFCIVGFLSYFQKIVDSRGIQESCMFWDLWEGMDFFFMLVMVMA